MRFKDKAVLVTGGAHAIGRTAALAFAREGARVMIADFEPLGARDTLADLQEINPASAWVRTDLRVEDDIVRMRDRAVAELGRIDVLVNNAGAPAHSPPLASITGEEWDACFAGNVRQTFLCCKHVLPQMIRQGGGAIVNVATIQAFVSTTSFYYGPAKSGIVNLTRHIALYHAADRVRANCVCPGHTVTPRQAQSFLNDPAILRMYPGGRLGKMEEIVAAYLYLASDEASFTNGAILIVDGACTTV